MNTMKTLALRAGMLLAVGAAAGAQGSFVTPRADRLTDEIIATDLARLDSLQGAYRTQGKARSAMLVGLAKDAYERNDDGTLTEQLIADARDGMKTVPRTRRTDMWATIDSSIASPAIFINPEDAIPKERELLRAQFQVLGAPNCDVHEAEAAKYVLRLRPPPPPKVESPKEQPVVKPEPPETPLPSLVHFQLDKYYLSPVTKLVLDTVVKEVLAHYPDVRISVEGHTDQRQTLGYNDTLSLNRATSVRNYLVKAGLDPNRLTTQAFSKRKLENDVPDIQDWARNRRVELVYTRPSAKAIPVTTQFGDLQFEKRKKK